MADSLADEEGMLGAGMGAAAVGATIWPSLSWDMLSSGFERARGVREERARVRRRVLSGGAMLMADCRYFGYGG